MDYNPWKGNYTNTIVRNNRIAGGFATDTPSDANDTLGTNNEDVIVKWVFPIFPADNTADANLESALLLVLAPGLVISMVRMSACLVPCTTTHSLAHLATPWLSPLPLTSPSRTTLLSVTPRSSVREDRTAARQRRRPALRRSS